MDEQEKNERQNLLERWAKLEPERCNNPDALNLYPSPTDVHPNRFFIKRGDSGAYIHLDDAVIHQCDNDLILGALIEAVTARGWRLELDIAEKQARADVWAADASGGTRLYWKQSKSAANALLAAYVAALGHGKEE